MLEENNDSASGYDHLQECVLYKLMIFSGFFLYSAT